MSKNYRKGKSSSKKNGSENRSFREGNSKPEFKGTNSVGEGRVANDPSWYNKNPNLTQAVGNFPFNSILGIPKALPPVMGSDLGDSWDRAYLNEAYVSQPGVLGIQWAPSIGRATSPTDPINVAAQNIFGYIRKENSGYANYDPCDLMSYLLAMDSIYAGIAWLKRVYGIAQIYNITNRYVPYAWLEACGMDRGLVQSNLAQLKASIDVLSSKAASLAVPASLDYMRRHQYMSSAIYTDVESFEKSQTYIFNPVFLWKRDDTNSNLVPISWTEMRDPFVACERVNSMLEAVLTSGDCGVISGDIRKAYGDSNLWMQSVLPVDYRTPVVYDTGMRSQIENCRALTWYPQDMSSWTVTQEQTEDLNGYLKFTPTLRTVNSACVISNLLNFHWSNPSAIDVMYATRLMPTFEKFEATDDGSDQLFSSIAHLGITGSEVIVGFAMFDRLDENDPPLFDSFVFTQEGTISGANFICNLSAFDWHPIIYLWDQVSGEYSFAGTIVDLDNYTVISNENLEKIHEVALLSLFDIPQFGMAK